MERKTIRNWAVLTTVLAAGIFAGLILAGSWNTTPAGYATEQALEALADPSPAMHQASYDAVAGEGRDADMAVLQQQGLPSLRESASMVRPAVVSIEVKSVREVEQMNPMNIPEEFRQYFRFDIPENPGPQIREGEGSGFIFSADGFIITNYHVVEGAIDIAVILPDKRRYTAEIVGTDELTDVAVIKIETDEELPTVQLGDSDHLEIGDWVLAVGNPLQLDYSVTAGIVSAKGRSFDLGPRDERNVGLAIQDYIQTDAVINRGNSGGPLVDLRGRVVGINTLIASSTGYYAGYGFAVPINLARSVARDLIEYGKVRRSWLGVAFRIIGATDARARSLPDNPPVGALISDVTPGGSADEAGIRPDDIILEIDGVPIDNSGKLQTLVSMKEPGSSVEMVVYRGGSSRREGRKLDLTVTLQERPEDASSAATERVEQKTDKLGLEVSDLSREEAREIGLRDGGVRIDSVEDYGPAYDARLGAGLVIAELDGEAVRDVEGYNRILSELNSGDYIMMKVYVPPSRQGATGTYQSVTVKVR